MKWWDCSRIGHRLIQGTLAQLYLELIRDAPQDPAGLDVARLWLAIGNRHAAWCPECGWFELQLPNPRGPFSTAFNTRLRRYT